MAAELFVASHRFGTCDAGELYVRDTAAGNWPELKGEQRVLAVTRSQNTKKNLDPRPSDPTSARHRVRAMVDR